MKRGGKRVIDLHVLMQEDYPQLYVFEVENRSFFEPFIPSRGEDYFNWASFCAINDERLKEQERKECLFFLIKNQANQIVGRINVVAMDDESKQTSIGHQIGEAFKGMGIASAPLNHLLALSEFRALDGLEGQTTTNNLASQRVFKKINLNKSVRQKKPLILTESKNILSTLKRIFGKEE